MDTQSQPNQYEDKDKLCKHCSTTKPISEFGVRKESKDGLNHMCKPCTREYKLARYHADPEYFAKYVADYRQRNISRVQQLTNLRNKKQYSTHGRARGAVHTAIKSGKLIKESCRDCGDVKVDFHHSNGYDEPNWLIGFWLCRKHHAREHVLLRGIAPIEQSLKQEEIR